MLEFEEQGKALDGGREVAWWKGRAESLFGKALHERENLRGGDRVQLRFGQPGISRAVAVP